MKTAGLLGLCASLLFLTPKGNAQCSGGSNGGALSPVPSSSYQTMNTTTGNYYTFTVSGSCMPTYDFSYCSADGSNATFDSQITILDNSGNYASGYNDDYCSLQSHVTWTPGAAGTYRVLVSSYPCTSGNSGTLAYKMTTPASMSLSSCTAVQSSTSGVTKCDLDQDVICVQVVTSGNCNALSLTQFQLGAGSSTSSSLADVSRIHIYYTGTTNTFGSSSEFVSGGTVPSGGTNTITGAQTLAAGTNYFWIAYDVNPSATTSNVIDASCTQITVSSSNYAPTATNPTGSRSISTCLSYPGAGTTNMKHWIKSDVGVVGTSSVSSWADQSGAGITGAMTQATAANQPSLQSSAINFQDYIRFDGSNDILVSANSFAGGSLYNATDNTIMMVKNIKSGLVDYKWETAPTGSYRVGEELNGSYQRIDFTNDGTGKNSSSTTSITNKDVLVEFVSDASSLTLKLNANTDASISQTNTFSPGTTTKPLNIGSNDLGNPLYCNVDIAEVMTFNKKLSTSELRRVESYLCLRYGITLANNKGSGSAVPYMASDGTQIWNNQTGYHNYVIGLGRDNASTNSSLHKTKTTSVSSLNGSTDIVTLANSSLSSPASITNDNSFLISGSNAGTLAAPILVGQTHGGPSTNIEYQLSRVWATQKTGTWSGNLIIQFDMTQVNGPTGYGTNINADLRLLVDDNSSFYDGSSGEHTYSPNAGYTTSGGTVNFTVSYTDIQNGTGYYTLGSVNATPGTLPIELADFKANCLESRTEITWSTATEINNDHFDLMRSFDGSNFTLAAKVNGHNNTLLPQNYSVELATESEITYYKLLQVDNNSAQKEYPAILASCHQISTSPKVGPNPFSQNFILHMQTSNGDKVNYILYNALGEIVLKNSEISSGGAFKKTVQAEARGMYFLQVEVNEKQYSFKLISQ